MLLTYMGIKKKLDRRAVSVQLKFEDSYFLLEKIYSSNRHQRKIKESFVVCIVNAYKKLMTKLIF